MSFGKVAMGWGIGAEGQGKQILRKTGTTSLFVEYSKCLDVIAVAVRGRVVIPPPAHPNVGGGRPLPRGGCPRSGGSREAGYPPGN